MKKIINHLIQLQELCFAYSEQEVLQAKDHLEQLQQSIQTLEDALPEDLSALFKKVSNHYKLAIVPMIKGVCKGCGMRLPISMAQEVEQAEKIFQCPNCARIIYPYEGDKIKFKLHKDKPDIIKLGVTRFSSVKLMKPSLGAKTKEEAIGELAKLMVTQGFIEESKEFVEQALNREAMASTAVGSDLAFPHVRGVEGGGLTFAIGLKKNGIKFGATDGTLSRIIFFIIIPAAASSFYLTLLSGLIQSFRDPEVRKSMFNSSTDKEMWLKLIKFTKDKIK